jgi:hypothetical protein
MEKNHIRQSGSPANATGRILTTLLLALAIPSHLWAAGPAPVNLLSTAPFVILSGAAITTTGGGTINGDVGASPIAGSAIGVNCAQMNGTIYAVDASGPPCAVVDATLLTAAKNDLTTAYNDAAGRPAGTGPNLNPGAGNIGGMNLAPGLYTFTTTALITGSDVTLTGGPDDVWIFQCAQDLQLGSGIKVILAGGARAKNIFWAVGTSAVLGTFSVFKGTILAEQAVTMNTSSTLEGRAMAFTAGVTYNGTGAGLPSTNAPGIAVQQPSGTNLVNDAVTNDFGSLAVGTNTSHTFTITNTGTADLTGLVITMAGVDAAMFSVTTNPAASVSPGGTTTFTVRFAPVSPGVKTAALNIANNDINNNPFTIALTGTGTGAGTVPGIAVQQPPGTNLVNGGGQNFGLVAVGTNTSLVFTITNIGTANLTGLGITVAGSNSALFTVTASPTTPLGPGGSTTFTVRFAPVSPGVKTAVLHIANNDLNNDPFNIALTGTGVDGTIVVSTNVFVVFLSAGVSPITLNPQTGLFEQSVQVTNSGPNTATAVSLFILNLPPDVRVYNASGSTTNGTPYVQYALPLAPATTVTFLVEYYRASRQTIPQPSFAVQETTLVSVTNTGSVFAIDRNVQLVGGRFLIEFSAVTGNRYAVQYSSDMQTWITADPVITAPANRVQWYDDGPPKTESQPGTIGSRFYRVMALP